jgi:hypothetical protein
MTKANERTKVLGQTSTETDASKKIHQFKRTAEHLVSHLPLASEIPCHLKNQKNFLILELTHLHSKTIGGATTTPATPQTPEEKAAELHAYDQKLYKAQCAMNESMSQVLKHLGVPFFGTHAALILPDSVGNTEMVGKDDKGNKVIDTQGDRPKWSPRITAKELMELKRRMVEHLEDMYKG